jgi:hypothetical protein
MDAYIYQAALLCSDCTRKVKEDLEERGMTPEDPDNEYSYDSDDYPKGPYSEGGGEADCPNHCDMCHEFLENPLTSEGDNYVREAVAEFHATGHGLVAGEWEYYYDYLF